MRVYEETNVRDFLFWSGAEDRADKLTDEDWDIVENELESQYSDGISDVELNDMFWFDFDNIVQMLGYENEEDFDRKRDPFYLDDDALEDYIEDYWQGYLDVIYEERGEDELKRIIEELFGDDADYVLENYKEEAVEKTPAGIYYHFLLTNYDSCELMETLFDNYQGWGMLDNFPTKEEFRDEMIINTKINS